MRRTSFPGRLALTVLLFFAFGSGCASYSTSLREAQADVRSGRPEAALDVLNDMLKVDTGEEIPPNLKKNRLLLLLERATLLQALGDYRTSARDMMAVDQRMEWLDLEGATAVDLGKYLYSGSATPYRAPAYERMLLNALNMLNFLALGDFQGAKVEARRFRLLEEFFSGPEGEATLVPELLALGNYLAGVAFEGSRDYDNAVRFYGRAWVNGFRDDAFREQLVDLGRVTGWRGRGVATAYNGLEDVLIESQLKGAMRPSEYRARYVEGALLVVVQTGLAPYKKAHRMPIGQAIVYSQHHHGHHRLSGAELARANRLAVSGALKWVNFPLLTDSGAGPKSVSVRVDGQPRDVAVLANVSNQVRAGWDDVAGALIGTAILRMVTRAVVGGATRAGSRAAAEAKDNAAIGVLGWIAGVAVEGAMTAADVPDTRSWTTLPAQIRIARIRRESGARRLEVNIGGHTVSRPIEASPSTIRIVNFSRVR